MVLINSSQYSEGCCCCCQGWPFGLTSTAFSRNRRKSGLLYRIFYKFWRHVVAWRLLESLPAKNRRLLNSKAFGGLQGPRWWNFVKKKFEEKLEKCGAVGTRCSLTLKGMERTTWLFCQVQLEILFLVFVVIFYKNSEWCSFLTWSLTWCGEKVA